MIRQLAGRLTGTAVSTVRFATAIPVGVARSVLERVVPHGSGESTPPAGAGTTATARQQTPQRDPGEQAAQAATTGPLASTEPAKPTSTPSKARTQAGTPKAGDVRQDDEPDVVLAVDAPPEEVEPPVDVVGEALAAERAQQAERPAQPQPVHVQEQTEVVYSSSSDDA